MTILTKIEIEKLDNEKILAELEKIDDAWLDKVGPFVDLDNETLDDYYIALTTEFDRRVML